MRTQIRHLACLLLGLLGFKALPAQAVDMFLCIDGVQGEVTAEQSAAHAGCIDVLAWSWGMSSSSGYTASGPQAGKVSIQGISVTKYLDRASPVLGIRVAGGKTLGPMALYVEAGCGVECATPAPIYRLEFPAGSFVISQSQGGSGGESRLTENVSINFPAVEWCYSYDADGPGGKTAPIDVCDGWDIVTSTPYP